MRRWFRRQGKDRERPQEDLPPLEAEAEPEFPSAAAPQILEPPETLTSEETPEAPDEVVGKEADEAQRQGLFRRLRERLSRTRDTLAGGLDRLFAGRKEVDAALLDELEELLITADLGVDTTLHLIQALKEKLKRRELG